MYYCQNHKFKLNKYDFKSGKQLKVVNLQLLIHFHNIFNSRKTKNAFPSKIKQELLM